MFLNKHNLVLAKFCQNDGNDNAYSGVLVTQTETVATDGHLLGMVEAPKHEVKAFPDVGVKPSKAPLKPCVIPREAAERLAKQLPKKSALPILLNAIVDVERSNAGDRFRAITCDGDMTSPLEARKIDAPFPDWKEVMPKGKPVYTTHFNAAYLAKICEIAASVSTSRSPVVKIEFFEEHGPIKVTTDNYDTKQKAVFLLMPITP